MHILPFTLFDSQGYGHHGNQIVSMLLLVQAGCVVWHCFRKRKLDLAPPDALLRGWLLWQSPPTTKTPIVAANDQGPLQLSLRVIPDDVDVRLNGKPIDRRSLGSPPEPPPGACPGPVRARQSGPAGPAGGGGGRPTTCRGGAASSPASRTGAPPWTLTWSDGCQQTVNSSPAIRSVSPAVTTT